MAKIPKCGRLSRPALWSTFWRTSKLKTISRFISSARRRRTKRCNSGVRESVRSGALPHASKVRCMESITEDESTRSYSFLPPSTRSTKKSAYNVSVLLSAGDFTVRWTVSPINIVIVAEYYCQTVAHLFPESSHTTILFTGNV